MPSLISVESLGNCHSVCLTRLPVCLANHHSVWRLEVHMDLKTSVLLLLEGPWTFQHIISHSKWEQLKRLKYRLLLMTFIHYPCISYCTWSPRKVEQKSRSECFLLNVRPQLHNTLKNSNEFCFVSRSSFIWCSVQRFLFFQDRCVELLFTLTRSVLQKHVLQHEMVTLLPHSYMKIN